MSKIYLSTGDLDIINAIVKENNISVFRLICDNSSGIGYSIDLEFDSEINHRKAKVTIPVCGSENW
jgi:hypothetical protein